VLIQHLKQTGKRWLAYKKGKTGRAALRYLRVVEGWQGITPGFIFHAVWAVNNSGRQGKAFSKQLKDFPEE
jgi:hypothetical protein